MPDLNPNPSAREEAREMLAKPDVLHSPDAYRRVIAALLAEPGSAGLSLEDYLMVCSIEEAAEVIQRGCKALRFGAGEVQPGQPYNNAQRFTSECIDFRAALELLRLNSDYVDRTMLQRTPGEAAVEAKKGRIAEFMALSRAEGRLQADATSASTASTGGAA